MAHNTPRYCVRTMAGVFIFESDDEGLARMAAQDHAANQKYDVRLIDTHTRTEETIPAPRR